MKAKLKVFLDNLGADFTIYKDSLTEKKSKELFAHSKLLLPAAESCQLLVNVDGGWRRFVKRNYFFVGKINE